MSEKLVLIADGPRYGECLAIKAGNTIRLYAPDPSHPPHCSYVDLWIQPIYLLLGHYEYSMYIAIDNDRELHESFVKQCFRFVLEDKALQGCVRVRSINNLLGNPYPPPNSNGWPNSKNTLLKHLTKTAVVL